MIIAAPTYFSRSDFVLATSEILGRAGAEHVFLHNTEDSNRDPNLDILISRSRRVTTDKLRLYGSHGRLLQHLDRDIPWFPYRVFENLGRCRPSRQIDVACDLHGVSRCWPELRLASDDFEKRLSNLVESELLSGGIAE